MRLGRSVVFSVGLASVLMVLCGGCALNLKLTTAPPNPHFGQNVDFSLDLTNESACPRGDITTLVIPFVPQTTIDGFLDEISDTDLRNAIAAFIDALCTGGDFEPPGDDGGFTCELVEGELVCIFDSDLTSTASTTEPKKMVVATTPGGDVMCEVAGDTVTCHVPTASSQAAQLSEGGSGALITPDMVCVPAGPVNFCFNSFLGSGETTHGSFQRAVMAAGLLRSFAISFPNTSGVCGDLDNGASVPCDVDGDCLGMANTCQFGICQGGDDAGRGCTLSVQCTNGGTCVSCLGSDPNFAVALACAQNLVGAPAPAATPWGLVGLAGMLTVLGGFGIRRFRRG